MAFSLRSGKTYATNNSDTFVELTDRTTDIGDELERTQVIDENQVKTPSKPSPASQFVNEICDAVDPIFSPIFPHGFQNHSFGIKR